MTTDDLGFADFFAQHNERLVRVSVFLTGHAIEGNLAQESMAWVLERCDLVSAMDDSEGYLYKTA